MKTRQIMSILTLVAGTAALGFSVQVFSQQILPDPSAPQISPQPSATPNATAPNTQPTTAAPVSGATTTTTTTTTTPAAANTEVRPSLTNQGATVSGTENGAEQTATDTTAAAAGTVVSADPSTATSAVEQLFTVSDKAWQDSQNINYRKISGIKWPSAFLGVSDLREKYKEVWNSRDLEMFKKIFNEYCLSYAALYGAEVEKEWSLEAGLLSLDRVCEGLKVQVDSAVPTDNYLFEYPNPLIMKKFDQAIYEFYRSPAFKLNAQVTKVAAIQDPAAPLVAAEEQNSDSLFGMLGLPAAFVPFVTELLLLLSLMLSFFLLYKVFKKQ